MVRLLMLPAGRKRRDVGQRTHCDCTTRPPRRRIADLVGFLTIAAVFAVGIGRAAPAQFVSGVDLVEVYATVTDARGEPVAGLGAPDFHLFEDDDPQGIAAFAAGEFPLALAVGLDRSFSMRAVVPALKSAARGFVAALRPDDRVMVIAIGSHMEIVSPLSADRQAAAAAIDRLDAWGTTPLYDSALAALREIQQANGRRALVLLSDGIDRYSDTSATVLVEEVRRRDVLVYPIAIGGPRPPVFVELASLSGGRPFFVAAGGLPSALATIARELRLQYLLGYTSSHRSARGEWHSIRVTVDRPDVRVRARDGYVAK